MQAATFNTLLASCVMLVEFTQSLTFLSDIYKRHSVNDFMSNNSLMGGRSSPKMKSKRSTKGSKKDSGETSRLCVNDSLRHKNYSKLDSLDSKNEQSEQFTIDDVSYFALFRFASAGDIVMFTLGITFAAIQGQKC